MTITIEHLKNSLKLRVTGVELINENFHITLQNNYFNVIKVRMRKGEGKFLEPSGVTITDVPVLEKLKKAMTEHYSMMTMCVEHCS